MIEIWYAILSFMLMMFLVLEGFDIGVGLLQFLVGKTEAERRLVIAAIGPLWPWHEVWLVGFGGTLLLAFPAALAVSFSGFYLALILLLWCLILRGISLEISGHIAEPLWRTAWHFIFVASNLLLAILIGAALGNVLRGVPLNAEGKFNLAFFTNFDPHGHVGILDWYTVSVAIFILATFAAHGANGLVQRTIGPVHERSRRLAHILWKIVAALLIVISFESRLLRPELFHHMMSQPCGRLGLAGVFGGLILIFIALHGNHENLALIGSSAFIAGLLIAGAAGSFPEMLHSTIGPQYSLTAYQAAADGYGLAAALVWWPIAFVLAFTYMGFTFQYYRGKVKPGQAK
jgi:cytochrome d ubiquinol oxidase subunit II